MTSNRSNLLLAALLAGIAAGCSASHEVGVKTIYRNGDPLLAGNVLAKAADVADANAATDVPKKGARLHDLWFAKHLQPAPGCGQPFLVVEQPDGSAVDLYYDELCI